MKDNVESFRYLKQIQSCGGSPTIWTFSYIKCELKLLSYICLVTCFSRAWELHVLCRPMHLVITRFVGGRQICPEQLDASNTSYYSQFAPAVTEDNPFRNTRDWKRSLG